MTPLRLAVLISGRGSNMEALIRASQTDRFPATPVLVLSNRPDAEGLSIARRLDVATAAIDHRAFGKDREAFERAMHAALRAANVDIIALAGFMRVLTPWFVNQWDGSMINIHPSLLPKYPGLDTYRRAIEAGDTEAGCTVHWVSETVDAGQIIDQAQVPIEVNDTPETLAQRILPVEHALYPRALAKACNQLLSKRTA